MHQDKDRILKLLGSGLGGEVVSATVGCDPSYISQLMSDEDFRQKVLALRIESLTADTARDRAIDEIEDVLIEKLKAGLDFLVSTKDILRAYAVINAAKRRGAKATDTTVVNNNIVNLILPRIIVQKYTLSRTGEVVEVEGRPLVTVPAQQLLANRKQREDDAKASKAAEIDDSRNSSASFATATGG